MNLDFTAPFPRPGLASWLLLAFGLAVTGWVMLAWQDAAVAQAAAQAQLARLQPKPARPPGKAGPADGKQLARQRGDDAARRQLSLPWSRLLESLQDARPPEIALLSLDADGRRGDFTLTALARNQAAMLDYFNALQHAPGLAQVSLSRHELRAAEGEQVVFFSLRGEWTPP